MLALFIIWLPTKLQLKSIQVRIQSMKLLIIVYKDNESLDIFMDKVKEENLAGFTIMPSQGVGRTSKKKVGEFSIGNLSKLFGGDRITNATVFSVVEDDKLARVLEILKEELSAIHEHGGGLYVVLPIDQFGGVD